MNTSIKDLGNTGNLEKATRILQAIKIAQKNNCKILLVYDPLIYGKRVVRFDEDIISTCSFAFSDRELYVIKDLEIITVKDWWDIIKVHLTF